MGVRAGNEMKGDCGPFLLMGAALTRQADYCTDIFMYSLCPKLLDTFNKSFYDDLFLTGLELDFIFFGKSNCIDGKKHY
jgi:hypothetical protein